MGSTADTQAAVNDYSPRIDHKEPLKLTGVLDQFDQFDTTPAIGTEFRTAQLVDWMQAPNADELLRDLAITSNNFTTTLTSTSSPISLQY